MKTIELKIYHFEELNPEAKQKAIEEVRNIYCEYNDFAQWAIDDCSLLEPKHDELINLFGKDYKFPLIENNRNIYFSLDRDRYIDISQGAEINNDEQFLTWLGIPKKIQNNLVFTLKNDSIEFEEYDYNYEFNEVEQEILEEAKEKFENHCYEILKRIENDIDYRFTNEAIIEDIESNEMFFLENGKKY